MTMLVTFHSHHTSRYLLIKETLWRYPSINGLQKLLYLIEVVVSERVEFAISLKNCRFRTFLIYYNFFKYSFVKNVKNVTVCTLYPVCKSAFFTLVLKWFKTLVVHHQRLMIFMKGKWLKGPVDTFYQIARGRCLFLTILQ